MYKRLMLLIMLFSLAIVILSGCGSQQTASVSSNESVKSAPTNEDFKSRIINTAQKASPNDYVAGELIVKFKTDTKSTQSTALHKANGATVLKNLGSINNGNLELVKLSKNMDVRDAMNAYMADPSVEYAEPNYKRHIASTIPNDTYFVRQWGFYNTGQMMNGSPGADIKAPLAWDFSKGSDKLIVAVIDTGIDYNHEDLFGKIWINSGETSCVDGIDNDKNGYIDDCYGWNFVNNHNNPMDDDGHGTHVSGVIGAATNNGLGISGLLWNVKIMSLKFLDANGSGTTAGAIEALNYAVKMGARIVNASYGSSSYSQAEYDSIANANNKGVLFISAAGNDSENNDIAPSYPCSYGLPNIISVAASDQNDNIASFSNFGPSKVDVAAPGVYILSLINLNGYLNKDFWPGTSMATPHVVGLAGLVLTQPEYVTLGISIHQARAIIETYVDKLPAFAGKIKTGGRINAHWSVTALLKPSNLQVNTTGPTSVEPLRVNLNWQNNATGAENIRIERMRVGIDNSFIEIANLSPNTSSYSDITVVGEASYQYRVRAYKGFNQSYLPASEKTIYTLYSNEVLVTTPNVLVSYGGSGGCSVSAAPIKKSGIDALFVLIPIALFAVLRRKKQR